MNKRMIAHPKCSDKKGASCYSIECARNRRRLAARVRSEQSAQGEGVGPLAGLVARVPGARVVPAGPWRPLSGNARLRLLADAARQGATTPLRNESGRGALCKASRAWHVHACDLDRRQNPNPLSHCPRSAKDSASRMGGAHPGNSMALAVRAMHCAAMIPLS